MNTYWLKKIRKNTYQKYSIEHWGFAKIPWKICSIQNVPISEIHQYKTKREALNELQKLWHFEAELFLYQNRSSRRNNKYPW